MELPIAHIFQGEKGGPVKEKLNKVIDIINSLGDDVSMNTGLLSNYVYFRKNDDNPSTPDVDILLYAYYGTLRWKVSGEIYQINLMSEGYEGTSGLNITLDAFDGEEGESRIDTIYAIAPPDLSDYTTGIKVRKGENSEYPTAPGINTATEVLLGYAYVGVGGFSEGSGTGTKIIYATFQELTNLKAANQIIAGQFYEMTDYATTHEINDSTNSGTTNIHVENTEPLLLLGLSSNEFHTQVYSKQFPKDIIHYDITNVRCEDRSTPRPGIITYRKDEWENETHFDFRGTKVYDGANNVYIFANSRNPGSLSFYGNKIGINNTYNNYFLFGNICNSNTLGNDCYSNTLGDYCYSNTLGDNCHSNTLGDYCYSNTLGDYCDSNTLGYGCYSNTLGFGCYSNTLGYGCYSNTLGDNCYSNILGDYCYSNTLGNDGNSNTLGNSCISNTLGNDCNSNTLGNDCYSNTLGYNCYSNILNTLSVGNIINKNCSYIAPEALNTSSILNTTFEADVSNITYLATATHLYATYHKTVFLYPDGTKKLRYFDNAGALQIVDVNA